MLDENSSTHIASAAGATAAMMVRRTRAERRLRLGLRLALVTRLPAMKCLPVRMCPRPNLGAPCLSIGVSPPPCRSSRAPDAPPPASLLQHHAAPSLSNHDT